VRPSIADTFRVPSIGHIDDSMYRPEVFIENGIIPMPETPRDLSSPPPPELYNLLDDPLESRNLAEWESDRVSRMLSELETWFEEVEADRLAIDDVWKMQ